MGAVPYLIFNEAPKGKYRFFEDTLSEVNSPEHPNLQYFIFKSIILNNLYGVDIMNEAVEIAKLRLFLKLMATVDVDYKKPNLGLEPLPDIDFNIRTGNTLIGFANYAEVEQAVKGANQMEMDLYNEMPKLAEKAETVSKVYQRFKNSQLIVDKGQESFRKTKEDLNKRLNELNEALNIYLAKKYGVDPEKEEKFERWRTSHHPFHWFAEFYGIIHDRGGFDVVIGNPPYVEYSKVRKQYKIKNYQTEKCGNLYAYVIERSVKLLKNYSFMSLIVPISLPSTPRMEEIRNLMVSNAYLTYCSNFADRPGTLFSGVHQKVTIFLTKVVKEKKHSAFFSSNFYHWYSKNLSNERDALFQLLTYSQDNCTVSVDSWLKIGRDIERKIWQKIFSNKRSILFLLSNNTGSFKIYLNMRLMFWTKCFLESKKSKEFKPFSFGKEIDAKAIMAILNSNLYFYFWETLSDCWHMTKRELEVFLLDFDKFSIEQRKQLAILGKRLERDLEKNKVYVRTAQTDYEYYHKKSKSIIDEIDEILAQHYGFTDEELDFIINYDIKYRMGKDLEAKDE